MPVDPTQTLGSSSETKAKIDKIYDACSTAAPNFGVSSDSFCRSLQRSVEKFAGANPSATVSDYDEFLTSVQSEDLFLAIACAGGNERAWWEFDQAHRQYMERVARHLAKTDVDATDIVDSVYEQLYGTRIVDGARVSKFATYSGRGSLRGWLRTVIWHSLVDLHRASHDEVSLDEMTENVGEGAAHSTFAEPAPGGETEMVDQLASRRYRTATLKAIETAFTSLDDHEKLLLLYYHVENLKLREIARLAEKDTSPLRGWFQRRAKARDGDTVARVHESTIMRWLEKCYARILQEFRSVLLDSHKLGDDEIDICMELATRDLAGNDVFKNLTATQP